MREGIRLLEQSGLVAREPSRRLSVAVPHYHRLATRMTRALILQQVTFRELWHTSRALEPAAVDQAMDNATDEDLAGLASNVDKTRKVARDPAAVAELDAEFHKLITKAAHNRVLLLAKEPSSMLVRPTTAFIISNNPGGIPRLIEAHGHILDALSAATATRAACGSTGTCATGRPASSAPAWTSTAPSTASTWPRSAPGRRRTRSGEQDRRARP